MTGAHHREIAAALPDGVEAVENPDWRAGRTGGIARALARRPGRDLCLAPAWEEAGAPAHGWLAPCFDEGGERRFGHPIVAGRELVARLAGWPPSRPLRELRELAEPLLAVAVDTRAILDALETPADLAALRGRAD